MKRLPMALALACALMLNGVSGVLRAGSAGDDQVCLYEADTLTDNVCFRTVGNELSITDTAGSNANINVSSIDSGSIFAAGTIQSTSATAFAAKNSTSAQVTTFDDTAPGDANGQGAFVMQARDSDSNIHAMAKLYLDVTDATSGAEYADLVAEAMTNGTEATEYWRNDASAGAFVLSMPLVVPTFTKSKTSSAGSANLGPTAPTFAIQDTLAGLQFDAAAETVGFNVELDDCWDGASDLTWKLYVTTETGDVIADTEVIEFDCTYRWLADNEPSDNGTAVTISPSYTQSGAGTDSSRHQIEATINYDSANQPVAAGDMLHMICNRDVASSDTYSGFVILESAELEFQCTTIPNH